MSKQLMKDLKYTNGDRVLIFIDYIVLTLLLVIILYPLLFVLSASFDSRPGTMGLSLLPAKFSTAGYKAVFEYKYIWSGYRNTLLYTVISTLINLAMTVCCAYPLSRKNFKGRNFVLILSMITMYFGGGLIPSYLLVRDLKLLDTIWAVILPGAMSVYNVIVMRTYFSTQIPGELLESAQLDGCGDINFLIRIVLPLSGPILAVIALFCAVGMWNSYFSAMIYLKDRDMFPLQLILREILIINTQDPSSTAGSSLSSIANMEERKSLMKYAVIVVSSVPVLVLYPFVQKYFVKGIMIGSLKG